MKTTCPKCGEKYDVSFREALGWIERNPKFRAAAATLIGRINAMKINPKNQSRGSEHARKAAMARWNKPGARKNKKTDTSDLGM